MAAIPRSLKLTPRLASEAENLSAILRYLDLHPRVAWAARFNSGAFVATHAAERGTGVAREKARYVRFNGLRGCPDILGQLKDGRLLAIEVKRQGWRGPGDDRERDQAAFLDLARANGAIALFATSLNEVEASITSAY